MKIHYPDLHNLFCDIVSGKAKSFKIAENQHFLSILDIAPVTKGHALIIPKRPVIELCQLSDEEILDMHRLIQEVSDKLTKRLNLVGISIMQNGGECNSVSYLHVHVIPRFDTVSIWKDDLSDNTRLEDVHSILSA